MTVTLRVVRSDATNEEVAALVAVFSLQTPATPSEAPSSEWPVPNRLRRSNLLRPRSWRASAHAY